MFACLVQTAVKLNSSVFMLFISLLFVGCFSAFVKYKYTKSKTVKKSWILIQKRTKFRQHKTSDSSFITLQTTNKIKWKDKTPFTAFRQLKTKKFIATSFLYLFSVFLWGIPLKSFWFRHRFSSTVAETFVTCWISYLFLQHYRHHKSKLPVLLPSLLNAINKSENHHLHICTQNFNFLPNFFKL